MKTEEAGIAHNTEDTKMTFTLGMLVGAAAAGALIVMLVPPKYEDWLRGWIITQWQKVTKKG